MGIPMANISDFPDNFQSYVKKNNLIWEFHLYDDSWVFWSGEEDPRCERPPPDLISHHTDVINSKFIENIKSFLRWLVPWLQEDCVLVQVWKAIEIGGRRLLTTRHQPFGLHNINEGLCRYRMISLDYEFYVDEEGSEEHLGLPGRVFRHQQLESTPNVGYYSCNEYPQRDRAVNCGITASLAFPMFDEPSGRCIGVLETVTTTSQTNSFVDGARCFDFSFLARGGLRSRKCNHDDEGDIYKAEVQLDEINRMLREVCRTHYLPLAQTWVLCRFCNHLFTNKFPNYVDRDTRPFFNACESYDPQKVQGVVGKAFSSHNLAFCKDITQFSITDYPLAHHARKLGLKGSFAICLQCSSVGDKVYVLEFFLPSSYTEGGDPEMTLDPILATMKQHLHRLTFASGKELGEELSIEVIDFSKDGKPYSFQMPQTARSPDRTQNGEEMVWLDLSDQQLPEVGAIDTGNNNVVSNTEKNNIVVTSLQQKTITNLPPKQHRKAGIPITLEDLQQHFGMKLEDAAESLGVSRSTLKRVCREYDILWWPSRKRNKDNNTLSNKFVQGAAQDQIPESSQLSISNPPHNQDLATASRTEPHFMAAQDTCIVTIKAKYGEDFIKFQLPASSGMVEFQRQVAKRLKLKGRTYRIKYQDDDNDWIIIGCDEDLREYLCNSRSQGRDSVIMSLQPITNCPP